MSENSVASSFFIAGGEIYTPSPGICNEAYCGICNNKMKVTRDVDGPTSWAEAMAKRSHLHDFFSCPHRNEDWHVQVKHLKEQIKKTASKLISEMLTQEVEQILKTKKTTKDRNSYTIFPESN